MKRNAKIATDRLQSIIMTDKVDGIDNLENLIKSDVTTLLENYFELLPSGVQVGIKSGEFGIEIDIHGEAKRTKSYGGFSK